MTDRELLEKAAKAAGIQPASFSGRDVGWHVPGRGIGSWNPLTDDGDALRLAVKLNLQVTVSPCYCDTYSPDHDVGFSENNADTYEATRRAIVKAAAVIGEAM